MSSLDKPVAPALTCRCSIRLPRRGKPGNLVSRVIFLIIATICTSPSFGQEGAGESASPFDERVDALVRQLGDDDFERREAAQAALQEMGPAAAPALDRAKYHEDYEIAWRARFLLESIRVTWTRPDDPAAVKELFARYDYLSDAEKVVRIQMMQSQPDEIKAVALARVTRDETNSSLSKLAALGLIGVEPLRVAASSGFDLSRDMLFDEGMGMGDPFVPLGGRIQIQGGLLLPNMPDFEFDPTELLQPLGSAPSKEEGKPKPEASDPAAFRALVERELAKCDRPGAEWYRAVSRFEAEKDLEKFLSTWRALRASETERDTPEQAGADQLRKAIADELLWYEADVLFRQGREEEGVAAARQLVETAAIGSNELERLVEWFTKSGRSELLEELAEKRTADFSRNPLLLYQIAEGFLKSSDEERAESLALKALSLNRGGSPMDLLKRQQVAAVLWERGAIAWAEREFQAAADQAQPGSTFALRAQHHLARLQFEDERPLDAAKGLEKMLGPEREKGELNPTLAEYQAQCDFFYADHYRRIGDREKEREHIVKALKGGLHDPGTLIDVLIAAWNTEGLPEDMRKTVKTQAEAMLARDLRAIAAQPDDPTPYNNYAWLCANTKLGDLNRAVAISKKSLEIAGENHAYLDTLAHCYHALGDLENAVKYQEQAAKLAPHAKVITSKLELFRKERDAAKKPESP